MNNRNLTRQKAILFVMMSCMLGVVHAQQSEQEVIKIIVQRDSLFWHDYNTCNVDDSRQFFIDSVEFYHDRGGPLYGNEKLASALKNNICGNDTVHVRREAVKGTVNVYVLYNGNNIYGAVISGDHKFYQQVGGKPEEWTGIAKFTHLWLLTDGQWKMTRILSYDHRPAPPQNLPKEIVLSKAALKSYAGIYNGRNGMTGTVKDGDGFLILSIDKNDYKMYPAGHNLFFSRERPLTFEFPMQKTGRPEKMIVRENGQVVDELTLKK